MDFKCELNVDQIASIYKKFTREKSIRITPENVSTVCSQIMKGLLFPTDEKQLENFKRKGLFPVEINLTNEDFESNKKFVDYLKGYILVGYFGKGAYGTVLKLKGRDGYKALKLVNRNETNKQEALNEVEKQDKVASKGAALKIDPALGIGSFVLTRNFRNFDGSIENTRDRAVIPIFAMKMETMTEGTLSDGVLDGRYNKSNMGTMLVQFMDLMGRLMDAKVIHADLHIDNIAIKGGNLLLIDFGKARNEVSRMEHFVDFIQFIAHLNSFRLTHREQQHKELNQYCAILANLLMVISNYLFGTRFRSIDNFRGLYRGGSCYFVQGYYDNPNPYVKEFYDEIGKEYKEYNPTNLVLLSFVDFNHGGFSRLNNEDRLQAKYSLADLREMWPSLKNPTLEEFKFLIKTMKEVNIKFIYDLVKYNENVKIVEEF